MSSLAYHLNQVAIGSNPADLRYAQPHILPSDHSILDVGCGIGQTLVTAGFASDAELYGVDVDRSAIEEGKQRYPQLHLEVASAEALPCPDQRFDLVICRVAMAYIDIPRALSEMHRVLRPGGRVWLLLSSFAMGRVCTFLRRGRMKAAMDGLYQYANGLALHFFGHLFHLPSGRIASLQTRGGITRALRRAGFVEIRCSDTRVRETFAAVASKP